MARFMIQIIDNGSQKYNKCQYFPNGQVLAFFISFYYSEQVILNLFQDLKYKGMPKQAIDVSSVERSAWRRLNSSLERH